MFYLELRYIYIALLKCNELNSFYNKVSYFITVRIFYFYAHILTMMGFHGAVVVGSMIRYDLILEYKSLFVVKTFRWVNVLQIELSFLSIGQ